MFSEWMSGFGTGLVVGILAIQFLIMGIEWYIQGSAFGFGGNDAD